MSDLATVLAEIHELCAPVSATRLPRSYVYSAGGRELTGGRAIAAARNRDSNGHGGRRTTEPKEEENG